MPFNIRLIYYFLIVNWTTISMADVWGAISIGVIELILYFEVKLSNALARLAELLETIINFLTGFSKIILTSSSISSLLASNTMISISLSSP